MQIADIIADLRAAGLTQQQIAARAGIAQSTVSQLSTGARGKRTSYETASVLTLLWTEVCGRRRPVRRPAQDTRAG